MDDKDDENALVENTDAKLDQEDDHKEDTKTGIVRRSTLLVYAKAMGNVWLGVLLLVFYVLTQASQLASIVAMGYWAEAAPEDQSSAFFYKLITSLILSVIVLASVRSQLTFFLTVRASENLHDAMTSAVLRARISFFDTNPVGRVLNRFSADVGSTDDALPQTLSDFLSTAFLCAGGVLTALTVLPFTLLAMPPLLYLFSKMKRTYLATSREVKRMEGVARSPIFSLLSESLSGIATIRSNGAVEHFSRKFQTAHDAHTRAYFMYIASARWFGFRMDGIMFLLTSICSLMAVLFHERKWVTVDPALLGLALTVLLQLTGSFQWCMRQSAEVVNLMVSVERLSAFAKLQPEAPLCKPEDKTLPATWPSRGQIQAINLSVRYRPSLPLSLQNLSFLIPGGSRVGIVGRTGAGKSTLVQSLLRLLEPESGRILVDDVDVSALGLHALRAAVSVIPQSPVLFAGCSVRENLDPFGVHADVDVLAALRDVQMEDCVMALADGLRAGVAEGGSNFSMGQRQLLCLARAVLRKSKILILDEPTANVDAETDVLLQEAVARSFRDSTILAVAHRLETVIDYDIIMVLGEGGRLLQFGSPKHLLEAKGGCFWQMVQETGEKMAESLKGRAFAKAK